MTLYQLPVVLMTSPSIVLVLINNVSMTRILCKYFLPVQIIVVILHPKPNEKQAMIELKVTVEDNNMAADLLSELNCRDGVLAEVVAKPYDIDKESHSMSVSELSAAYGTAGDRNNMDDAILYYFTHSEEQKQEPLRVVSHDELSMCIPLEEFRNEMEDMIHKHYHPQE